jgi:hypothetical protein
MYWCKDFDLSSRDIADADAHSGKRAEGAEPATPIPPPASTIAYPAVAPQPSPTLTATTPEFKTCPDCADQIRFAARKCRFCGYMFESAEVSG